MALMTITIQGEKQVIAVLESMRARASDLTAPMLDIGMHIVEVAQNSIDTQTDPYGNAYKPMSIATKIARARRLSGPKGIYTKKKKDGTGQRTKAGVLGMIQSMLLLKDRGHLYSGIQVIKKSKESVSVGVATAGPATYAPVQQFGGGKSRIPARPFMPLKGMPKASIDYIHDAIARHINAPA